MGKSATRPSVFPPAPISTSPSSVPTLEQMYEMTSVPERRVVMRGVDWAFYEQLVDSIPEGANLHVDFDGKDLEIMGKGRKHEGIKELIGFLIRVIAGELGRAYKGLGETTWKRPEIARGIEADQCYYFQRDKLAAYAAGHARDSDDIADFPNPDLAIEVDISAPLTDRAGIYAALRVAEVWRFVDDRIVIDRLGDDGSYHPEEVSIFLSVRAEEIRRRVVVEDSSEEGTWERRIREWLRAEVVPRLPG